MSIFESSDPLLKALLEFDVNEDPRSMGLSEEQVDDLLGKMVFMHSRLTDERHVEEITQAARSGHAPKGIDGIFLEAIPALVPRIEMMIAMLAFLKSGTDDKWKPSSVKIVSGDGGGVHKALEQLGEEMISKRDKTAAIGMSESMRMIIIEDGDDIYGCLGLPAQLGADRSEVLGVIEEIVTNLYDEDGKRREDRMAQATDDDTKNIVSRLNRQASKKKTGLSGKVIFK